jgi:predicted NBD/HSP70 family sugar kinase
MMFMLIILLNNRFENGSVNRTMSTLSKVGDQKLLQSLNRNLILNTIDHHGSISRIDISKATKLSQSTVSNLVDTLQKEGYVIEVGTGSSTRAGGRRPTFLTINPSGAHILAVAIVTEAFHITLQVCLFDLKLTIVKEMEFELREKGLPLLEAILAVIRDFIHEHEEKNILGLGFSVPTVLDREGVIYRGHLLELENYPLESELKKVFPKLPIIVEQEQHAAIMGERAIGQAKEMENVIYITVGRGIGSSVIVNNQLVRGEHGGAGEIGHMSINKFGAKCICGKNGCLRLYATELAFINKIKESIHNEIPLSHKIYNPAIDRILVREVYKEALNGDQFSKDLLMSLLDDLCIGISNLIYLINPRMLILGGNLLLAKEIAIPYMHKRLKEIADSPSAEIQIMEASLGNKSSVYGVASMVLDKHFLNKDFILNYA